MIEQKVRKLNDYFDRQISLCEQCNIKLLADDRMDEAAFEKVKANIYDVFRTIFSVAVQNGKGDSEAVKSFFILKTEQIPSNWATAYNKAKQYDDAVKMQIEQIKLDTVGEIKKMFETVWEGEE